MTFDVTTFGEAMLRLSVPEGVRLQAAAQLDVNLAGAEANVVSLLARLGRRTAWHSALPRNPLGYRIADPLRAAGVDLSGVSWHERGRVGTYYLEFSSPPRANQVIYDRADSCITRMTPDMVQWDKLLDTRLVHLTGITPPLSPSCAEIIQSTITYAREHDLPVSFDINYRQKLWSEADARDWLTPLIQGVNLLFCARADARRVFGVDGTPDAIIAALAEISRAKAIIVSLGDEGAVAWDGSTLYHQAALPVRIIDRIGAGDGLASGIIHGWLDGNLELGLRQGVALAALALSQFGDSVITTQEELEALLVQTHGSASILR